MKSLFLVALLGLALLQSTMAFTFNNGAEIFDGEEDVSGLPYACTQLNNPASFPNANEIKELSVMCQAYENNIKNGNLGD